MSGSWAGYTHLGSMNSLHKCVRSPGLSETERRQMLRALDQQSLAPFGTCCRVGMWDLRMVVREGKELTVVDEVSVWSSDYV